MDEGPWILANRFGWGSEVVDSEKMNRRIPWERHFNLAISC
jgi:hypothetical protein